MATDRQPLTRLLRERFQAWLRPAVYLGHNPATLAGAVLTTSSGIILVWFWIFEVVRGGAIAPYAGIILYLILPGLFVAGLVLMPAGAIWRRRRLVSEGRLPSVYPRIDFHQPVLRRAAILVGGLTFANVVIIGAASYRGIEYMDSVQFCGQTCHTVMQPEYAAYRGSPHSRVACVDCHIGPGAPWFVRSKISGTRQLFAVALKTYETPIPSPVENLRPARETCEHCHWPQKFSGEKLVVRKHYSDDETNSALTTVLLLKIGGRRPNGLSGIHGHHIDTPERINYIAIDRQRQVIPVVNFTGIDGKTVTYVSTEVKTTPEQLARGEHRTMDCMDCHNRPTHAFQMPAQAVDDAISAGTISPALPYIKKKAVEVLKVNYPDRPTASREIARALSDYYQTQFPAAYQTHRALVEAAVNAVQGIYDRNVFPAMKVTWGTYPNNIGHNDFLGCFRCHDGSHKSADGRVIADDCDTCHTILADEESDPKVLSELGLK